MGNWRRLIGLATVCVGVLVPAAAASAAPQYVALGDSYSSGVGTRVFYEESGECDRSPDAYGPKIAAAKGYTLNFEACSGAKTPEVNISLMASTSVVSRVTRRPTGLRSKKPMCICCMCRKIWLRISNITFCPVHCISQVCSASRM